MVNQFSRTQLLLGKEGMDRQVSGSNAYVPAVAGLICAGEVINDIALNRV